MNSRVQKLIARQDNALTSYPYLIKVTHDDFGDMYFANSPENIDYDNNVYNAASFSIQPPDRDGAKIGDATLTLSAVDQEWIYRIRSTQKPATLQFMAVIAYEDGIYQGIEKLEENSFTLRNVQWDELTISWEMNFDERQQFIITSVKCTPQIAPGCA